MTPVDDPMDADQSFRDNFLAPTSAWEDPRLAVAGLAPGQIYTGIITILLVLGLVLFGTADPPVATDRLTLDDVASANSERPAPSPGAPPLAPTTDSSPLAPTGTSPSFAPPRPSNPNPDPARAPSTTTSTVPTATTTTTTTTTTTPAGDPPLPIPVPGP